MKKAAFVLTAACFPAAAMAGPSFFTSTDDTEGPGYTYIQGEYIPQQADLDGTGEDYQGYGGEASYQLPYHLFVEGHYDRLDVEHSGVDINRGHAGIGAEGFYDYGGLKGTGLGYYATVDYERLGFHDVGGNADVTGNGVGGTIGLRWMALPGVEINPTVGYTYYPGIDGDGIDYGDSRGLNYGVRALGYLNEHFALSASYEKTDYDIGSDNIDFENEVSVGVRYAF